MKVAAADAIAAIVADDLRPEAIVPSPLDPRVAPAVAAAVAAAAIEDGVARRVAVPDHAPAAERQPV
jgi:malate dehydrogenase (oxaloacetate-decarboxylating)